MTCSEEIFLLLHLECLNTISIVVIYSAILTIWMIRSGELLKLVLMSVVICLFL